MKGVALSPLRITHFEASASPFSHSWNGLMENTMGNTLVFEFNRTLGDLKAYFCSYDTCFLANAWSELSRVRGLLYCAVFTLVSLSNTPCSPENWMNFSPGIIILSGSLQNPFQPTEIEMHVCTHSYTDSHTQSLFGAQSVKYFSPFAHTFLQSDPASSRLEPGTRNFACVIRRKSLCRGSSPSLWNNTKCHDVSFYVEN